MEHVHQQPFPWRLFWLLFAIGIIGALAVIPLAIELFGSVVVTAEAPSIPLLLLLIGLVQNLGILAVMILSPGSSWVESLVWERLY